MKIALQFFYIFKMTSYLETMMNERNMIRNSRSMVFSVVTAAKNAELEDYADYKLFIDICKSVLKNNFFKYDDIKECIEQTINSQAYDVYRDNGSLLVWTAPFSFANIYGFTQGNDFEKFVTDILTVADISDSSKEICLEYVKLLHDILMHTVGKDEILEILPELNSADNNLPEGTSIQDTLFTSLFIFVNSGSYEEAFEKSTNLDNTNSWIILTSCILTGVYYGYGHDSDLDLLLA